MMAYGGRKPAPFQQAICQSQALEPGITGNFTIDAMQALVDHVGCNTTDLHSKATIACLRNLDTQTLLTASLTTYQSDISHNIGDIWLPSVDGDFLPAAPSTLIRTGRFATTTTMLGWCEDDVTFFTDPTITTPADTHAFITSYLPGVSPANIATLLTLYPTSDFTPRATPGLSPEFFRTARIFRDLLMVCPPLWYGAHLARAGGSNAAGVYLYDWNQTVLEPVLRRETGRAGWGPVHSSEFAYVFGSVGEYDAAGYPVEPTEADYALVGRGARAWAGFAATGRPGGHGGGGGGGGGEEGFRGFERAFGGGDGEEEVRVFVVGGPEEGLSSIDGRGAREAVRRQRLRERCAFINSDEMIEQMGY
jgi:carboxylesterase type B